MMKWLLSLMLSLGALMADSMSYPASLYDEVIVKNAKIAHENAQKMGIVTGKQIGRAHV